MAFTKLLRDVFSSIQLQYRMEKLPSYLNLLYLARMCAVGIAFTAASIGVLPVFLLRSGDTRNNKVFCSVINFMLLRILGIKMEVDTSAAVYNDRSVVCVVNHQGVLDVIACGAVLPTRSSTLAKRSLGKIPIWGTIFRHGGNILVDRGDSSARRIAMNGMNDIIKNKKGSLLIFPEGTRNRSNQIKRFHDGAFRCAQQTKTSIQPVAISTFAGNINFRRWNTGTIAIKVLPPVDMSQETDISIPEAVEKIKNRMQAEIDRLDGLVSSLI